MSPRPNPLRTVGAEDRFRELLLRWLDDNERSVSWLARKVTEAGCPMAQSSLWKVFNADRAIRVNEAVVIAEVIGVRLQDLVS